MFCNKYVQMLFPAWLFISMMDNIWYLFVLKLSKFWKFLDCLENFQESSLTTKKVSILLGKVWDWLESFQTDWNQVLDICNTVLTGYWVFKVSNDHCKVEYDAGGGRQSLSALVTNDFAFSQKPSELLQFRNYCPNYINKRHFRRKRKNEYFKESLPKNCTHYLKFW